MQKPERWMPDSVVFRSRPGNDNGRNPYEVDLSIIAIRALEELSERARLPVHVVASRAILAAHQARHRRRYMRLAK